MNISLKDLEAVERQLDGMAERMTPMAVLQAQDIQAIAIGVHFLIKVEIERRREAPDPWDDDIERGAIQNEPSRLLTIWERLRKPEV